MMFIPDVVLEDEGGYYCSARIGLVNALSQTAYLEEISKYVIYLHNDTHKWFSITHANVCDIIIVTLYW